MYRDTESNLSSSCILYCALHLHNSWRELWYEWGTALQSWRSKYFL